MITKEVNRLWIRAVVAGCSVLPIFRNIRASAACVNALPNARETPNADNSEVSLIMLIGFIIKKTPINPNITADHLIRPIFSFKTNGDKRVT